MSSATTERPRTSTLPVDTAKQLAITEYARTAELLEALPPAAWSLRTECPAWDVRQMAAHVLGMGHMASSLRDQIRQQRAARRRGGVFIDALTALQVDERSAMGPEEIVRDYAQTWPKAARARFRTPRFVRKRTLPDPETVGGIPEAWTIGFLVETVLTRDVWMHRIDVCRAVGVVPVLTQEHDGVLVADVVAEWAARHGQPCRLTLTGPAGGQWTFGTGGPTLELDAVQFCRTLAGREPAQGLLDVEVPF